jgi:hypothetical protein
MKKEFAGIFAVFVAVIWANLSEHEKKLAMENWIEDLELELLYSMLGKVEKMEFIDNDDTDSNAMVSDSDESSGDTVSDSGKTPNDIQLVLAVPSTNVTVDTSGASISENASHIVTYSNSATAEGNLDTTPTSKRDRIWSTATNRGNDDEMETKEDE